MKKLIAAILYSIFIILYSSSFAHANESALSVSPAIIESVVDKGGYTKSEIYLSNLTNFPLPIKAIVTKFLANEVIKDDGKNTYDASSWFKLEPADFILQPNEKKKILLTITAPRDAEPGGHYATIFFQPLIPTEVLNSPNALARVGVLGFLIVPGNSQELVTISDFKIPSWQAFGPTGFELELQNSGNIHSTVTGTIEVTDLLHRHISSIPISATTILPNTHKKLDLTWDYRIGLGKFIFTPNLTYGASSTSLKMNPVSIWLIPWPLMLITITLLTFIYKIFILNVSRVKLAWRALRGKSLQEKEIENDQIQPQQKIVKKRTRRINRPSRRRRSY